MIVDSLWHRDIRGLLVLHRSNDQFLRIGSKILYKHVCLHLDSWRIAIPWLYMRQICEHVRSLTITEKKI